MSENGFPQPRPTRSELRNKLHSILDSMIDRLPLAEDHDGQIAGYIDLTKLKVEQHVGVEDGPDGLRHTMHATLKVEIFPELSGSTKEKA